MKNERDDNEEVDNADWDNCEIKGTVKGQDKPITPGQLYLLEQVLKEYRKSVPNIEQNLMLRHKLKVQYDFIAHILSKGIKEFIDDQIETRNSFRLKEMVREEEDEEE